MNTDTHDTTDQGIRERMEIIQRKLESEDADQVGSVLQQYVRGTDREERKATRELMKYQPELFLNALQQGPEALGITSKGTAAVFEDVFDQVDDSEKASRLATGIVSRANIQRMVAERGDLGSTAALTLPLEIVFRSMLKDLGTVEIGVREPAPEDFGTEADQQDKALAKEVAGGKPPAKTASDAELDNAIRNASVDAEVAAEEEDEAGGQDEGSEDKPAADASEKDEEDEEETAELSRPSAPSNYVHYNLEASFLVMAWCMKLKDREDYMEFLKLQMSDGFLVREHLVIAIWIDANRPSLRRLEDGDISPDRFEDFGLDFFESRDALAAILSGERIPRFTKEAVAEAHAAELKRQKTKRQAPVLAPSAMGAKDVADKIDD